MRNKSLLVILALSLLAFGALMYMARWKGPEAWKGDYVVQTEQVAVETSNGRTWCETGGRWRPNAFGIAITNYSDQDMRPDVAVSSPWLQCRPDPVIRAGHTDQVDIKVVVPYGVPDGVYPMVVVVSAGGTSQEVPVVVGVGESLRVSEAPRTRRAST